MKSLWQAYLNVSACLPIEDKKVKDRLDRGLGILQSYGYSLEKNSDNSYTIRKASTSLLEDVSAQYTVTSESCSCPDFPSARGGLCKHRLAVMILNEQEAE
jgi:hypothetical protein